MYPAARGACVARPLLVVEVLLLALAEGTGYRSLVPSTIGLGFDVQALDHPLVGSHHESLDGEKRRDVFRSH